MSRKVTKLYEPIGKLLGRADGVGTVAVGRSVMAGFIIAVATGVAGSVGVADEPSPLLRDCQYKA